MLLWDPKNATCTYKVKRELGRHTEKNSANVIQVEKMMWRIWR